MSGVRRRRRASSSTASSSFSPPSSLSDSDYIADADVSDPDASLLYDSSSRSGHLRPSSLSSSFFPSLSSLSSSSAFLLSTPPSSLRIFLFLVAFRLVNAWTVRTFFQPDEFFQSLEPAWRAAFGDDHAPWITWVSSSLSIGAFRSVPPCIFQETRCHHHNSSANLLGLCKTNNQ